MKRLLVLLAFVAITNSLTAEEPRTKSRLLYGFEDPRDIASLLKQSENIDLIAVQDNGVTEGKNCARLIAKRGSEYSSLRFDANAIKNWKDFDYLAVDVFSEDDQPHIVVAELWDAASKNYPTRCTFEGFKTRAGRQTLLYPINRARRNGKEGREWAELQPQDKIDLNGLTQVKLFLTPAKDRDTILWIDNIRLLQEDAAKPKLKVPLPPSAIAFNFGSPGTNAPGFKTVSPQTLFSKSEFGFTSSKDLQHGGDGWPDLLAGTFVMPEEGATLEFQAKVEGGEYFVWLCAGPILRQAPKDRHFLLKVNSETLAEAKPSVEEYFSTKYLHRFMRSEFTTDPHFLWDTYIDRMYPVYRFRIAARDGIVKLTAKNYFVSAMVLVPAADVKNFDSFEVEARKLRREAFEATLPQRKLVVNEAPKAPQDFVAFVPDLSRPIRPDLLPKRDEAKPPTFKLAGAPGQRLSFRLAVHPFASLGKCQLKAADLVGVKKSIGKEHLKTYLNSYRFDGENLSESVLLPGNEWNGVADVTRCVHFWLTIPENVPDGKYSAKFQLRIKDQVVQIPVEVEVDPFPLEADPPASFGMYYASRKPAGLSNDAQLKLVRGQLQFMREIGFTAVPIGVPTVTGLGKGDHVNLQFDDSLLSLAKELGFGRTPKQYLMGGTLGIGRGIGRRLQGSIGAKVDQNPGLELQQPEFRGYFQDGLKQYSDWIAKSGMPVAVEMVDEPREYPNPWNRNLADTLTYAKMVRDAGLTGFVTPMGDSNNGKDYTSLANECDIVSVHAWKGSEGLMKRTAEKKGTLWIYNTGMDRFSWGFYNWRAGSQGRWEWHFCAPEDTAKGGYPGRDWFNPFTGSNGLACDAPLDLPGGIAFSPAFFEVSEGITDYRYLVTLMKVIALAESLGKNKDAVKEAKQFLAALERSIPQFPQTKGLANASDGALVGMGIDDEAKQFTPFWREKIAKLIKDLQR